MSRGQAACVAIMVTVLAGAGAPVWFAQAAAASPPKASRGGEGDAVDGAERLHRQFDEDWKAILELWPEFATSIGVSDFDDRWSDESFEGLERRRAFFAGALERLGGIDRNALDAGDRLNLDLYRRHLSLALESYRYPDAWMPVSQLGGVQQRVPSMLEIMPRRTTADYEHILARLRGVPARIDQTMARMHKGIEEGIVFPRVPLRAVPEQVQNLLPEEPLESPLLFPFREMPPGMAQEDRGRLVSGAVAVYRDALRPAFQRFHTFLVETYLPACRDTVGLSALPEGKAWYAFRVRRSTTTDLTPSEIHEIGLAEVRRIRAAMEAIVEETGFQGDLAAFFEFLRTDPRFFHRDAASLLRDYRDIAKRADPELARLFGHLPRLPYGVIPVPAYMERSQTTAFYRSGSLEAGRPGYFYANTYDLPSRPSWEMEALTLHEAVPGHHLQISLAQELDGVPAFRRWGIPGSSTTAFVEGWGLYAESLGREMGFYTDPYSRFGQLTYEMWRAIRLVVDTGLHAMGWTRRQAIDFFAANAGKASHDIEVEVDRYIVWPGQALAYKIGELRIRKLRERAAATLGDRFDVRGFHDTVLGAGAVPLDVLERRVGAWIQAQRQG